MLPGMYPLLLFCSVSEDRFVSDALAVENEGEVAPVETVFAGVIAEPPGSFNPTLGTAPATDSVAPIVVAVGGLGVNGLGLVAPVAAALTV